MSRLVDLPSDYPPPGMEVGLIERFVDLRGKKVLEIGAGDGRLTAQYAHRAAMVVAVEPDRARVALARRAAAEAKLANVTIRAGMAERVRLGGGGFDIALFSWSL